jgi:VanZ family protein
MTRVSRVALAWAPVLLYMALIWGLSSIRIDAARVDLFPLKDKGVHFVEYGALGFLAAHAVRSTWPSRAPWRIYGTAVLVAFGWGLLDEFHQSFVPGRFGEVADAVADGLGAMTGAAALLIIHNLRTRRRARKRS